jgi:hypothetical protein
MNPETIQSLKELQVRMPAIIQQFGNDNKFTQIALANPIAALERAGFHFTENAKEEIENYVRFGRTGLDKLQVLRGDIFKYFGGQVNLNNTEALTDAILRVVPPSEEKTPGKSKQDKTAYTSSARLQRNELIKILNTEPKPGDKEWHDALQTYSTLHPIFPLVIEYRKMQAENPAFARPEQLRVIEEKLQKLPLKNVVFTLQRNNPDEHR